MIKCSGEEWKDIHFFDGRGFGVRVRVRVGVIRNTRLNTIWIRSPDRGHRGDSISRREL